MQPIMLAACAAGRPHSWPPALLVQTMYDLNLDLSHTLCQAMTSPVVLEEREDGARIQKGDGEKIAMCAPCCMAPPVQGCCAPVLCADMQGARFSEGLS